MLILIRYFFYLYVGDGEDYLNLALKDGGISLSINLGSGTLDTGIGQISSDKKKSVRFDDDQWHHVYIKRVAQEVSLFMIFMRCWGFSYIYRNIYLDIEDNNMRNLINHWLFMYLSSKFLFSLHANAPFSKLTFIPVTYPQPN